MGGSKCSRGRKVKMLHRWFPNFFGMASNYMWSNVEKKWIWIVGHEQLCDSVYWGKGKWKSEVWLMCFFTLGYPGGKGDTAVGNPFFSALIRKWASNVVKLTFLSRWYTNDNVKWLCAKSFQRENHKWCWCFCHSVHYCIHVRCQIQQKWSKFIFFNRKDI